MSVQEVYKEAARKILLQGYIDVLLFCQAPRKTKSLPSWVPDWAMEVRHPCAQPPWLTSFEASGGWVSIPTFPSEVCVFIGGNAAYVVRPEENELHSLVGEAYVHGVMYGELLKGGFEQRKLYTIR